MQLAISGNRVVSISEIEEEARRLAAWLRRHGVGAGDVVAVLAWNDFPYLVLPRACALIGAYSLPLNWHLTRAELDFILQDSAAKALIGHSHLLYKAGLSNRADLLVMSVPTPTEVAAVYPKECDKDASGNWHDWKTTLAAEEPVTGNPLPGHRGGVFYTSGTTGKPKGVVRAPLSDEQAARVKGRTLEGFGLLGSTPGAMTLAPGPLYHSAPNAHALYAWGMGHDLVLMPRFDARAALDLIMRHRVSHAHFVPTMFSRLLALPEETRHAFNPASLRAICHGAAPCPPEVKRAMIGWWGEVICEYYAGTETGVITGIAAGDWLVHPGSVGRALGETEVQVIGEDGAEVPAGATGRLICASDSTRNFDYHGRPGAKDVPGWPGYVALGDIGHVDAGGFVYLTDRSSDVVISGGVNIYPAEIEKELMVLPGVADCAVVGVPMVELGEGVIALVEPIVGQSPSEAALLSGLRERLAGFKLPRKILFVDRLPREDSGKIRKRVLQETHRDILKEPQK
ncbi:MAG: AMP-binding protein [Paracoccaceae bacterium]